MTFEEAMALYRGKPFCAATVRRLQETWREDDAETFFSLERLGDMRALDKALRLLDMQRALYEVSFLEEHLVIVSSFLKRVSV